jgi:hypothetical protein
MAVGNFSTIQSYYIRVPRWSGSTLLDGKYTNKAGTTSFANLHIAASTHGSYSGWAVDTSLSAQGGAPAVPVIRGTDQPAGHADGNEIYTPPSSSLFTSNSSNYSGAGLLLDSSNQRVKESKIYVATC